VEDELGGACSANMGEEERMNVAGRKDSGKEIIRKTKA
jgi:hypothetical protein